MELTPDIVKYLLACETQEQTTFLPLESQLAFEFMGLNDKQCTELCTKFRTMSDKEKHELASKSKTQYDLGG